MQYINEQHLYGTAELISSFDVKDRLSWLILISFQMENILVISRGKLTIQNKTVELILNLSNELSVLFEKKHTLPLKETLEMPLSVISLINNHSFPWKVMQQ